MRIAVIGAGPAGLTAGYLLARAGGNEVTVFEAHPRLVGGISRTETYKGYLFDIGGHRFFSKSQEVEEFWTEMLGDDLLRRPRSSRIYYAGRFYSYPLRVFEALHNLGTIEAARCVLSYLRFRLKPIRDPRNFEEWVTNNFGQRLFEIFFKTYTEKVWGMSCTEISADWAAQRIKGLSLFGALRNAVLPQRSSGQGTIKTLIDSYRYPRRGPGMLWEACARKMQEGGGRLELGARVGSCAYDRQSRTWTVRYEQGGRRHEHVADHVVSSAPLRELVHGLHPTPPEATRQAASALRYRDFLVVVLILEEQNRLTDNWIYVHDPGVKVGRIQNFKSWSPEMVPDPKMCAYGLEYFCFEGDGLWSAPDTALIELARTEIERIGLVRAGQVLDGCVVRQPKAYPVYDDSYRSHVSAIRGELVRAYPGLHLVGRNGMHKYNNQDHAIMTGMLTVRNILAGRAVYDPWLVNEDAEYHESGETGAAADFGERLVPRRSGSDA